MAQHPFEMLDLDRELTTDQRMIRDVVAQFGREHIASNLREWFEKESLPARELARELGSLGLLGMHLEGYDCAGTDATSYGLACLELEALDSGIRSLVSVQGSLAGKRLAALDSQRPTLAPTRVACAQRLGRTARTGFSTAQNSGLQTQPSPTLPLFGRRRTLGSMASWYQLTRQALALD